MTTDTLEAPAPAVEKTAEIAESITGVHTEVAKFDAINAGLLALEQAHPLNVIVAAIDTPAGMRAAETAWRAYRNPRLEVEKARKSAKAPVLALGRAIDAFAGQLEARLTIGETHYKAQITAEETRRATVKAEAERKERERIEGLQAGIAKLRGYVERAAGQPAESIQRAIDALDGLAFLADDWQEFLAEAASTRDATVAKLRELHAQAVEAEAQRAEAERLRVLAEQQAAELAALRAREAAREAAERDEQEEAARLAREAAHRESEVAACQAVAAEAQAETAAPAAPTWPPAVAPVSAPMQSMLAAPATQDLAALGRQAVQAAEMVDLQRAAAAAEPATLKLGAICARLGFTMTAAFVADALDIKPAKVEGVARLYRESDFGRICAALQTHIERVHATYQDEVMA